MELPGNNSHWMSEEEYKLVTEKTPIPTVDLVILRSRKNRLEVLLLIRKTGYAAGQHCLIGGRQWIGETLADTIKRQADDLTVKVKVMKPFTPNFPAWIYDKPGQDKTKQSLTHVYPVKIVSGKVREEGEEYKGFEWFPAGDLPEIAYDQAKEIIMAIKQLENFKEK